MHHCLQFIKVWLWGKLVLLYFVVLKIQSRDVSPLDDLTWLQTLEAEKGPRLSTPCSTGLSVLGTMSTTKRGWGELGIFKNEDKQLTEHLVRNWQIYLDVVTDSLIHQQIMVNGRRGAVMKWEPTRKDRPYTAAYLSLSLLRMRVSCCMGLCLWLVLGSLNLWTLVAAKVTSTTKDQWSDRIHACALTYFYALHIGKVLCCQV